MYFEAKIIEFLQSNASMGWVRFFTYFTALASIVGLVFFGLIIFNKDKALALWFALTFAFTAIFNLVLKTIIRRPRPFATYDFILNLGNESGFSMPSSHSALAGMIAVFMCFVALKFGKYKTTKVLTFIVMILFVAMICLSRMMLGVHYLTDTLVGVVEGVGIGLLSVFLQELLIRKLIKRLQNKNKD